MNDKDQFITDMARLTPQTDQEIDEASIEANAEDCRAFSAMIRRAKKLLDEPDEPATQKRRFRFDPSRCPSRHWDDGTGICTDCGVNLN